jgi:hypothetical protein
MALPLLLAPVLSKLAESGLNILSSAISAKGKQVVENTLGVKIPDEASELTPELLSQLKIKEMEHEEELLHIAIKQQELEIKSNEVAQTAVTDRWKADMTSDSWLSKNIRPIVLVYLLSAYSLFSLLSAFNVDINQAYIELLAQWGMLVMSAYFVGRTGEKVMSMKNRKRDD